MTLKHYMCKLFGVHSCYVRNPIYTRLYVSLLMTVRNELRETNLMSLALLLHYLMLNRFRMLIHPSSGACGLFVELFHGLYCSGSMRVGVTLWFGWGGVASGYHTPPAKPQRNTNTHRTRAIQPMN